MTEPKPKPALSPLVRKASMKNPLQKQGETQVSSGNQATMSSSSQIVSVRNFAARQGIERGNSNINEDYDDKVEDMTFGRRIAMKLRKNKRYNPLYYEESNPISSERRSSVATIFSIIRPSTSPQSSVNAPSLKSAWEYFEHRILPRYIDWENEDEVKQRTKPVSCFNNNRTFEKAKPSETRGTKLYPILQTSTENLGNFGIGMYLYFLNMRYLVALTLVAGLLNVNTMQYFASDQYDPSPVKEYDYLLKRSAVCTNQIWVACPSCTKSNFSSDFETERYAYATVEADLSTVVPVVADERHRIDLSNDESYENLTITSYGEGNLISPSNVTTLYFGLQNDCGGNYFIPGMVTFSTVLLMTFGMWYINFELNQSAILCDENEQTAQDYSIKVKNPPFDSYDPEEWKEFFSHFDNARVTCCSINVDNDLLVNSLLERRERLRQIEMILPPGTPLDDTNLARIAAEQEEERTLLAYLISVFFHPFGLFLDIPALYARVAVLTAKIKGISQRTYRVKSVYITFETEKDQRFVRAALAVPKLSTMLNTGINNKEYMFRGALVLDIDEAPEPETIHWRHMNTNITEKMKATIVVNIISLFIIAGLFFVIETVNKAQPYLLAPVITVLNLLFPYCARMFTRYEKHGTETDVQASLYFKTMIFRLVNTVVVLYITTDFTATTNKEGLLKTVVSVFFSEIITVNALAILDPYGHFCRHYLGPRQKTQDRMNRCFVGKDVQLAERYTTSAKLIILCATYFVIFPSSLFLCSLALFVNYHVDKFCLLRTWTPIRRLEAATMKVHTDIFTPILLFTLAFTSAYWWAGFPFDNICEHENTAVSDVYIGTHTITVGNGNVHEVTIYEGDQIFQFCNQDMLSRLFQKTNNKGFPPFPRFQETKWMTEEQEKVAYFFSGLLIAMVFVSIFYFLYNVTSSLLSLFHAAKPIGDDQGIPFSSIPSITSYIPEVDSNEFSYPLLICSIDNIDHRLITWKDPKKSYSYYNLINDAKEILGEEMESEDCNGSVFDRVKHWPVYENVTFENNNSLESLPSLN